MYLIKILLSIVFVFFLFVYFNLIDMKTSQENVQKRDIKLTPNKRRIMQKNLINKHKCEL